MVDRPFKRLLSFPSLLWVLIFSSICLPVFADTLTVKTERQQIEQGDIISLWVEADFQTLGNQLDYAVLEHDFQVLSRQRSNFYEFVNGKQSAKTRWHLRLLPKNSGKITIPPLTLGDIQSTPLQIEVKQSSQSGDQAKNFFLTAEIDQTQGYVQQQFIYKLRFYYRGKLLPGTGNIRPVSFGNALTETLKDESIYNTMIDGKTYTVHEWLYALFPQQSGSLTIPGTQISGIARIDGRQKAIDERANDISLRVLAAVPGQKYSKQQPWLPAKSMLIQQNWQQIPQQIQVGDSLSRVITLQAFGLKASQLPSIETAAGQGYKIYSQPPKSEEDKLDSGVISRIQITQNIVPTAAGEIEIPPYQLRWFNTETKAFETLTLPGQKFQIQAAANQPDYQQVETEQTQAKPKSNSITEDQNKSNLEWLIWPLLTTFFAIAWVITLVMWWLARGQKRSVPATGQETGEQNEAELNIQQWCQADDKTYYQHLRKHLLTHLQITHLAELSELDSDLDTGAIQQKIHLFEQQLFSDDNSETDTEALKAEICQMLGKIKSRKKPKKRWNKSTQLQTLYPQK